MTNLKDIILMENYYKFIMGKYSLLTYYDNIYKTVENFSEKA